jgi:hypothetical protein
VVKRRLAVLVGIAMVWAVGFFALQPGLPASASICLSARGIWRSGHYIWGTAQNICAGRVRAVLLEYTHSGWKVRGVSPWVYGGGWEVARARSYCTYVGPDSYRTWQLNAYDGAGDTRSVRRWMRCA